ncbi:hypothetical protein pb186bvf_000883 [Paramecium bursaria]
MNVVTIFQRFSNKNDEPLLISPDDQIKIIDRPQQVQTFCALMIYKCQSILHKFQKQE